LATFGPIRPFRPDRVVGIFKVRCADGADQVFLFSGAQERQHHVHLDQAVAFVDLSVGCSWPARARDPGSNPDERVASPAVHQQYRNLYHARMKTTLNLNDQLLADAKAFAAQQRTSLTRLIEEGLQLRLRAHANSAQRAKVHLPVFKGRGGLVKGVDPLSNKALLEALDNDA